MTTRFDRDTASERTAPGHYRARIDKGWFVARGPNGGYVAALVLRALLDAVSEPSRAPRSLSIHFTEPPAEGPVEVHTTLERRGRSLTTASARLVQGDRPVALALAAFSKTRESQRFSEIRMPLVRPPEACERMEARIPIHEHYEQRFAIGDPPFSGGDRALVGGWIRLAQGDRALDAPLVAAYTDAWPPAIFSRIANPSLSRGVPTVDLTIHFRATLPIANARADEPVLAVFRSQLASEGFMEEDGEIWSRDGVLLAQSRQLAIVT